MSYLNDLLNVLKNDISGLAKEKLDGRVKETKKDTLAFLKETQEDFQRWMKLIKDRNLSQEEFVWLAKSKKDLMELHALKQSGLTLIEADLFKDDLISTIIRGALSLIKLI